jgi:protein-S-isoprenylcysteine O-methyltransferase Ste14
MLRLSGGHRRRCIIDKKRARMRMGVLFFLLMTLDLACMATFQWGRAVYFRRSEKNRVRGGLGPIGTILALGQFPLVWVGGLTSGVGRLAGAAGLFSVSLLMFLWAVRSHKGNRPEIAFTSAAPEVLVTAGAYQVARHPFYLAYILFWAATAVVAPYFTGLGMLLVMAVLYHRAAAQEEALIMASPLSASYAEYASRVGRFFRWVRF